MALNLKIVKPDLSVGEYISVVSDMATGQSFTGGVEIVRIGG